MATNSLRRRMLMAAGSLSLVQFTPVVRAQGWPSRTVTLVVPWPAGNPTDSIARKLQPLLARSLGQSVIVENVPGAGGTLGVGRVNAAPPDGHTVLVSTPIELILSPIGMAGARYQASDFRMVGIFGRVPYVLVSRPDLPHTTLSEILAVKDRRDDKPLSYGSIGNGSLIHLISAKFAKTTGVPMLHVPYQGLPPLVQALLGGQIDVAFLPVNGSTNDFIQQGKLRAFGITAAEPFALFPQIPALATGHPALAGFNFDVWGGFHIPRAAPPEVAARWHRVFYEVTLDADFRAWARSTGTDLLAPMSLGELQGYYDREIQQYQSLAKSIAATS